MTVDEAQEALLVAFVGNATDGPIARALKPRIDALIAAVRAEERERAIALARVNGELGIALVDAEAKLAALRETLERQGSTTADGMFVIRADVLLAALAATPAEDGEGRT